MKIMKTIFQILTEYYQPHMYPEKTNIDDCDDFDNSPKLKGQKHSKTARKFGRGLYKRQ